MLSGSMLSFSSSMLSASEIVCDAMGMRASKSVVSYTKSLTVCLPAVSFEYELLVNCTLKSRCLLNSCIKKEIEDSGVIIYGG
jgi:hypothetical protein